MYDGFSFPLVSLYHHHHQQQQQQQQQHFCRANPYLTNCC